MKNKHHVCEYVINLFQSFITMSQDAYRIDHKYTKLI